MTAGSLTGGFDHSDTARRQEWDGLPAAVQSAIEEEIDGPVHSLRLGYMPGDPWTAADLEAIHISLLTVQKALIHLPGEVTGGPMSTGISDDPMVGTAFSRFACDGIFPGLPPSGISSRLDELQQLCDRSTEALRGDAVLHNDLRADNVLLRRCDGRAFICDWNFLAHGPEWADWVGILIYARNGGIDPAPGLAQSPLSAEGIRTTSTAGSQFSPPT